MNRIFVATAVLALSGAAAFAQAPQPQGDAQKDLTTCAPSSAGTTSGTSADDSKGVQQGAMAVEKSAILPSAGGYQQSAAPTVQRQGESVEARADCPPDARQPKPKS